MNKKCTKAILITSSLACALVQVLPIKHNNFCLTVTDRKLSDGIAGNEQGLALLGDLKLFRSELKPNIVAKVEDKNKKPNSITSAGTEAQ